MGRLIAATKRREVIVERMQILVEHARACVDTNPDLAKRYALLARRISSKTRVRMPYHLRISYCKKCKSFLSPRTDSRVRLGRGGGDRSSTKAIRITCLFCGHTYRKVIAIS